jgi:hypothetical protein
MRLNYSKDLKYDIHKIFYSNSFFNFYKSFVFSKKKEDKVQIFKISETPVFNYTKPKFFDMFKYIPKDLGDFGRFTVKT